MNDPILQDLFPQNAVSAPEQNINSDTRPLSNDLFFAPPDYYRSVLDFGIGEYNLANISSYYISYAFPSGFAQENLLYLQLLASELNSPEHFTRRKDLRSYLCAQTFHGNGLLIYNGKEYPLAPGDVFLIDCRALHEYRSVGSAGWGYRIIHFNGSTMPGLFSCFSESGEYVFHFSGNDKIYQYTRKLFQTRSLGNVSSEIDEHCILTSIIAELIKKLPQFTAATYPERTISVRRYLKEHCTDSLSLEQTANHFHISKYHLCRDYKKHTGETLFQYVTKCRMEIATYLLVNSSLSVEQVSEQCGFENVNSFFYAFKKYAKCAPTTYKKLHSR